MPSLAAPTLPEPSSRNPFSGKGLAISMTLLLGGGRQWSLAALAAAAGSSRALASRVVLELRRLGLVSGEVAQGRRASVQPVRGLFAAVLDHWPGAAGYVAGRLPRDVPVGGGPALAAAGVPSDARPRVYVRSVDEARRLLALHGGALVTEPVADYEIAILDVGLEPGPVPPLLAALELGATPRGREILDGHPELLAGLPAT